MRVDHLDQKERELLADRAAIQQKRVHEVNKFNVGEQIPLKGVWFRIESIDDKTITLRAIAFTNTEREKRGLTKKSGRA